MSSNHLWNTKGKRRVLRELVVVALLLVAVTAFGSTLQSIARVSIDSLSAIYASVLAVLANDDRKLEQTAELKINELLTQAAQLKANDMVQKNYFAHISPEGLSPWYWMDQAGYDYQYAGENLAVNFSESVDVNRAWMNSPLHRANILNKRFTEIGIAMATGTYQGREAVYVVQMFGTPAFR